MMVRRLRPVLLLVLSMIMALPAAAAAEEKPKGAPAPSQDGKRSSWRLRALGHPDGCRQRHDHFREEQP